MKVKDVDALREQISKDPREVFTKHQVWLFASEYNKTVPTVEAIPKDQYETRLKDDMLAMLTDIQLEIEELDPFGDEWSDSLDACNNIIQQKINALKAGRNY